MTTIVCGDDHAVFLEALVSILQNHGMQVVGTGRTLAEVADTVGRTEPDICLLDRRFGDGDRADGVTTVLAAGPHTKVIMLTADSTNDGMRTALQAGAVGYVNKTSGLEYLIGTIHGVARGEVRFDVPAQRRIAPGPGKPKDVELRARYLTLRERQCLALLVDGHATGAMAERLGVSVTTVRTHVRTLLTKLGVHSRLEAAALAVRYTLVAPEDTVPAATAAPC